MFWSSGDEGSTGINFNMNDDSSNSIALDNAEIVATVTTRRGATVWVVQPSSSAGMKGVTSPYRIYEQCAICLTTVGTNTAELGALGKWARQSRAILSRTWEAVHNPLGMLVCVV